jgi:hypothetical protein
LFVRRDAESLRPGRRRPITVVPLLETRHVPAPERSAAQLRARCFVALAIRHTDAHAHLQADPHTGSDVTGQFGIHDQRATADFEAVIGVGGVGPEPRSEGLDCKVNWIGIGPYKRAVAGKRGPVVTFDHFVFYGSDGPDFEKLAPLLSERIYSRNVRALMKGLSPGEQQEVSKILIRAKHAPPSSAGASLKRRLKGCSRRRIAAPRPSNHCMIAADRAA